MKIFGFEIRAVDRQKRQPVPMVGDAFVGNTSLLGGYLRYGSTDRNWRAEAGQLETNSTTAIALAKIAQKVAQAKLCVKTHNPDGSVTWTQDRNLVPWKAPLPQLDEQTLLKSVACSLKVYGNAYLLKRRS